MSKLQISIATIGSTYSLTNGKQPGILQMVPHDVSSQILESDLESEKESELESESESELESGFESARAAQAMPSLRIA